jgi:HD-GYP domain-containing protein (c-di-GMP phosphodiesterase class II)
MTTHRIKVLHNGQEIKSQPVGAGLTIGRNPENGFVLDMPEISRQHAIIEPNGTMIMLRDLGSGNGVFVEGRRVIEYKLTPGQVFHLGSIEMSLEEEKDDIWFSPISQPHEINEPVKSPVSLESPVNPQSPVSPESPNIQASVASNQFNTMFTQMGQLSSNTDTEDIQRRLAAVYEANQIIASEQDITKLLAKVMEQFVSLVSAANGVIMLMDPQEGVLKSVHEYSKDPQGPIRASSTIIKQSFKQAEAMLIFDASSDQRINPSQSIIAENITSVMCVPLLHHEEKLGIVYVDTRGSKSAFSQRDLELLTALAGPSAIAIKNAQYVEQLEEEFQTTLKLLANAIEMRDHYTLGHTWRVTKYSMAIAREMGWSEDKIKEVQMGGVLHDIGKIAVEDAILRKPARLDDEEYAKMKVHPERGASLMKDSKKLEPLIPYCLYHHENYDGSGYPYGLRENNIPIEGRVVAVADTFDAMTSNRPYRDGLDPEVAIEEIEKNKGTQFDPVAADAFIRAYRAGNIQKFMQLKQEEDINGVVCPFCSTFIEIPDNAQANDTHQCNVCHRHIKLVEEHDVLYGTLLTESDLENLRRNTPPRSIISPIPKTD